MYTLQKPIIKKLAVSRVPNGQYATYSISVGGDVVYVGKAVVINNNIEVRVDAVLRSIAWRWDVQQDAGSQRMQPAVLSGSVTEVKTHAFEVEIMCDTSTETFEVSNTDDEYMSPDEFGTFCHLTPRIPAIDTTNMWLGLVASGCNGSCKLLVDDTMFASCNSGESVIGWAFTLKEILSYVTTIPERVTLLNSEQRRVTLATFDKCPDMAGYYVSYITTDGGWMCYPFEGSLIEGDSVERNTIVDFYGVERVVSSKATRTYQLHSGLVNNLYFDELSKGIAESRLCYVYDVKKDRGEYCIAEEASSEGMPSRSNKMQSVAVKLRSIEKEARV